MAPGFTISLLRVEGMRLASLVDEFRGLLSDGDPTDAAILRLTPDPYPGDADAGRSYAESTRSDIYDRRRADAAAVRAALAEFPLDADGLSEEDALREHDVRVTAATLDSWLRTLNAIRLVLAERLEISADDDHDPADPRFAVYEWLGYRLELLIQSADELPPS
ncbi:DUF2017 family protein [Microbacterium sp. 179-I 3D4 NHS]|uniref:DUF2017 family protein n=1 Tax=Microbacterium sp. 179-I 3D4 NHS TaxID=3142381 RepID=UPI0039A3AEF4